MIREFNQLVKVKIRLTSHLRLLGSVLHQNVHAIQVMLCYFLLIENDSSSDHGR